MIRSITRRGFLATGTTLAAGVAAGFPSILLPKKKEKLGVALVGLGGYSRGRLAPGLQLTEHCELRGIVTGTPSKIPEWQERYGIPDRNVYSYDTMHEIANNDDIDVIYSVTPPGLHARDSIAGAEAGKHVWCEKPMTQTVEECQSIVDAARKNNVRLSIGYRMKHEPNTEMIIRFGQEETYGKVTSVRSGAGFRGSWEPDNWRVGSELGGGALYDMGVYAISAARYATGMEPVAVRGRQWSDRDLLSEVDEHTEFELEFPGGVRMVGETSFGESMNYLDVEAEEGSYHLRPFQSYSGVEGETSDGIELPPDPNHQQARQMDRDAVAIMEGEEMAAPGEDGLADIRIVEAIQESSRQGGEWLELS
ncbi:MAG: Gfo/Idh/MocA family protein [Bacteroidota bacterium]